MPFLRCSTNTNLEGGGRNVYNLDKNWKNKNYTFL